MGCLIVDWGEDSYFWSCSCGENCDNFRFLIEAINAGMAHTAAQHTYPDHSDD